MINNILFIFYFYPVKFAFLPISSSRLVLLLAIFHFIFNPPKYSFLQNYYSRFIPFIIFLLLISISVNIGNSRFDLTVFFNIFEIFIVYPIASIFLISRLTEKWTALTVFEVLLKVRFVIYFQTFFIYFMIVIPDFKLAYLNLLNTGIPDYHYPFRQVGITGFTAYNMGIFLNLIILVEFLMIKNVKNNSISFVYFKILFVLIPSLMLSGSGIVVPLLSFVFFTYIIFNEIYGGNRFKFALSFNIIFLSLPIVIIAAAIFLIEAFPILEWTLDPLLSISNGNIPEGASVLSQQYWYPGDFSFLFGDGYFTNEFGAYYMETDGGYMRFILFFGLPTSIIFYSTIIAVLNYFAKIARDFKYLNHVFYIVLFSILITQYKGNIIFDGSELIKFVMILAFSVFKYEGELRKQSKLIGILK